MKKLFTIACTLYTLAAFAQPCATFISSSDSLGNNGTSNYFTFTANGTYYPTTVFSWSFGDGSGGQGQVVTHTYAGVPNTEYILTLTVTDSVHGCNYVAYDTVIIFSYNQSPCQISFASSHLDTFYTLYTINTGVPPFTYLWELPDGSTSVLPDPTYTITGTGYYSGIVYVTDSTGCLDSIGFEISTANTNPDTGAGCQAYFYVVPDSAAGVYTAVDCSTGAGLNYLWAFGDGDASVLQYPTHTYTVPGNYTICLSITAANGCFSEFCDSTFYAGKNAGGPMSQLNVVGKSGLNGIPAIAGGAGISVYPNPATSQLILKADANDKILGSTIYDTYGNAVASYGASTTLMIDKLPAGMYLIDIQSGSGSYRTNFVKKD